MKKLLLMDCDGEKRPRVAFLLSLAGYEVCQARDVVEAMNRISLARETMQEYSAFILNNPESDEELLFLVEICKRASLCLPVIFITNRLTEKCEARIKELRQLLPRISHCHHLEVLEHLSSAIAGDSFP